MDSSGTERGSSSASLKVKSWQLLLAPWTEEQRTALRRFGEDGSFASLFALRADDHQLECFFTCKAPRRAAWMAAHIVDGDWRPASAPKSNDERRSLLAKYQEGSDRSIKGQRTDLTSSTVAASSSTDDPMPVPDPSPPSAVSEPHVICHRLTCRCLRCQVLSQPSHASALPGAVSWCIDYSRNLDRLLNATVFVALFYNPRLRLLRRAALHARFVRPRRHGRALACRGFAVTQHLIRKCFSAPRAGGTHVPQAIRVG